MSRILIVGTLAWDRPIWLEAPLARGVRLRGRTLAGALEGRLGGGGANAGAPLVAVGHDVAVMSLVSDAGDGPRIMAAAAAAGIDLSAVARTRRHGGQTLLLIEPGGERIVLGLDSQWRREVDSGDISALSLATQRARAFNPRALYVRSPLPGAADLMNAIEGPIVVHWPTSPDVLAKAPILVGSADDLPPGASENPYATARASGAASLRACIVTQGAGPVIIGLQAERIEVAPPPAVPKDTTGAGDIFAAGLIDALCEGAGLSDAVQHACLWGAAAVAIDGSAPVDLAGGMFPGFRRGAP
jgi:sugar/nucleoside kinase (ribokinase family)